MKIYMDRTACSCWQASCEASFGWRLVHRDFSPGGCIVETFEEGYPITFYIKDRDGQDKELIVDEDNWPDAYNSWLLLWEKQEAERQVTA